MSMDIKKIDFHFKKTELEKAMQLYLDILFELIKKQKYYRRNIRTILREWLYKIFQMLDALENIILFCEELYDPYKNELNWTKALSLESMVLIIEKLKEEILLLRGQVGYRAEFYDRIREKAFIYLTSRFMQLLDILITTIAIEMGELPPSEIVSVVGKRMSEIKKPIKG